MEEEDSCCCLYNCYCHTCCCWVAGWLKFVGWTQIGLYSTLALFTVLSIIATWITKEPERCTGISFHWTEVLLTLSVWIPWILITLPAVIVEILSHCFVKLFPFLDTTVTLRKNGRSIRGQLLLRVFLTLIILQIGIYMGWRLVIGVNQKDVMELTVWTIYVGLLVILTIIEAIWILWGKLDFGFIFWVLISLTVHGFNFGATVYLMAADDQFQEVDIGQTDTNGIIDLDKIFNQSIVT